MSIPATRGLNNSGPANARVRRARIVRRGWKMTFRFSKFALPPAAKSGPVGLAMVLISGGVWQSRLLNGFAICAPSPTTARGQHVRRPGAEVKTATPGGRSPSRLEPAWLVQGDA
jgi:hypothetical protein